MKRIIIYLLLLLPLISCEDFLKEVPKDELSETNFYKTVTDCQAAVNAIYGPIASSQLYGEQYLLQIEIPADYAYGRGSTLPIGGEYDGLDAINIGRVGLMWGAFHRLRNRKKPL
jgi:hypothetical protein